MRRGRQGESFTGTWKYYRDTVTEESPHVQVPVGNGCCAILVLLQIYWIPQARGEGGKLFTGMWAKAKQEGGDKFDKIVGKMRKSARE